MTPIFCAAQDTDCYQRCGEHPVTGRSYRCTHGLQLYTYAGVGMPDVSDPNIAAGLKSLGGMFTIDYPGDNRFDVENTSKGVCTDSNVAYGTTNCRSLGSAKATLAFAGCTGRLLGWATTWCGVTIDVVGPDYVTDVGISEASEPYPRILVPAARVNGKEQLEVTCSNGFDCQVRASF